VTMKEMNLLETTSVRYPGRRFRKPKRLDRLPRGQFADTLKNVEGFAIIFDGTAEWVWFDEGKYRVYNCYGWSCFNGGRFVAS